MGQLDNYFPNMAYEEEKAQKQNNSYLHFLHNY